MVKRRILEEIFLSKKGIFYLNNQTEIENYWKQFVKEKGISATNYSAWSFGDSKQMADELAELVVKGDKTATTSAYDLYEIGEKIPEVGEYNMILDGNHHPICITQTKVAEIVPFNFVSAEHAYHEGEGDRTLSYWRKVHEDFFKREYADANKTFSEDIPCLCEVFKVV